MSAAVAPRAPRARRSSVCGRVEHRRTRSHALEPPVRGRFAGRLTLNSALAYRYAPGSIEPSFRAGGSLVLSELWNSKSRERPDLQQVRVRHEERRAEVQGDDAHDEPERGGAGSGPAACGWRGGSFGRRGERARLWR